MGTNMPGDNHDALEWLEGRITGWVADPAAIGLTSAVVSDLAADIIDTRTSFTSVEQIRQGSKAATTAFHLNGDDMRTNASNAIATIKSFAVNSADPPAVYTAAGITPPDPQSPVAPPEQPTGLKATLNGDGSVTISWEARGPVGTVYNVSRKLATETVFTFIGQGAAQDKQFIDATVPAGTITAAYIIQGVRGGNLGLMSNAMTVFFGTADAGAGEMGLAA
ncbi:MAG: hypothetical protein IH985_05665 [Planctomycetes bacterium]|nr:hypothetical protein [Planctomycetota bacterium]